MAKIDIIIPVYNGENFIGQTIKSIEDNNFADINIILVDDGSIDGTESLISKLREKYGNISYYKKENGGVSAARNFAIERSASPYICFLDADDLYHKDFLSKMYGQIEATNADTCTCGYYKLYDKKIVPMKSAFSKKDFLVDYLISKNKLHISSFLIKREVIFDNNIRFDESSSYGEDIEFMTRVIKHSGKIEIVPEYLTYYRIDSDRPTLSTFSLDKIKADIDFSNRLINDRKLNLSPREKAAVNHKLVANIVNKLMTGLDLGYDKKEIREIYEANKSIIGKNTMEFGLRSIKLILTIKKLRNKIGY